MRMLYSSVINSPVSSELNVLLGGGAWLKEEGHCVMAYL